MKRILAAVWFVGVASGQVTQMPGSAAFKETRTYLNNGFVYLDANKVGIAGLTTCNLAGWSGTQWTCPTFPAPGAIWKSNGSRIPVPAVAGTDFENPLTFSGPLGRAGNAIACAVATGSVAGCLSAADWTVFNAKQAALNAAGVVAMFTGCSGTQYLGADGACHTSGGGTNGTSLQFLRSDGAGGFGTAVTLVPESAGGTGANNTPGAAGHVLRSNGTHYVDGAIQAGDVTGLNAAAVGLGSVDNTSDAGKPVSTATQTALNSKAPLASPTFSGTVDAHGASKTLPDRSGTGSPNGRDNCATVGESFFQTDATAGSNSWACTAIGTPGVWTLQGGDTSALVPNTRTVNGHPLSSNVTVTASDLGLSVNQNTREIPVYFDGTGAAIVSGSEGCGPVFSTMVLKSVVIWTSDTATSSGTAKIDWRVATEATYAASGPAGASSINGGTGISLAAAWVGLDTAVSSFTTTVTGAYDGTTKTLSGTLTAPIWVCPVLTVTGSITPSTVGGKLVGAAN